MNMSLPNHRNAMLYIPTGSRRWPPPTATQIFMFRKINHSFLNHAYKLFGTGYQQTVWFTNMVNRQPEKQILEWCNDNGIRCEDHGPASVLMELSSNERQRLPWAPEYHRLSFSSYEDYMAYKIAFIDADIQIINPLEN
jgi:hypothetical protein